MCTGECNVTVQAIDEDVECPFARMRFLAILESIEAMEEGIRGRERRYPHLLA
jgi:hypothetical protein